MRGEFARLEHFAHDVATADEFALHIELRDRRPIGEILDALANTFVFEHIDALIGHAQMVENLHDLTGETAHRKIRRAFHEEHDIIAGDFVFDLRLHVGHVSIPLIGRRSRFRRVSSI